MSVARRAGRTRQTGSLGLTARGPLRALIGATQGTRFGPFITPQTFELSGDADALASGQREYEDGDRFFANFDGALTSEAIAGRDVLDLGCGYGGRTVYYAERFAPRHITGIEISEMMVDRCRRFAERMGVAVSTEFLVAFGEDLPFADAAFDTVLSYDVVEHVQDPVRVMEEIHRVLRPGGEAWLVFPTYKGARASHLDYLTQIPALHRVFDPDAIIDVVNEFLVADPERYGVKPQPRADVGVLGRRALPTVNGLDQREARAVIEGAGLEIVEAAVEPMITERAPVPLAGPATSLLQAWSRRGRLPDLLVGHLTFRLRRPR